MRSLRTTRLATALLLAALALLAIAPAAFADVTTRPRIESFGIDGPGACPGFSQVTGTGDTSAATGTGDFNALATGLGDRSSGSRTIANLIVFEGTFAVGEAISGPGIPAGTTIAAVNSGAGTLTLSQAATSSDTRGSLFSGSRTITNVSTDRGAFEVGQAISGFGIASGTTITAVGAGTLTLSTGVPSAGTDSALAAGSTEVTNVSAACGAFAVGQTISGPGIAPGTTIAALGAGALTLSRPASAANGEPGAGVPLTATRLFDFPVALAFDQALPRLYAYDRASGANAIHAFDAPALAPSGGAFPLATASEASTPRLAVDTTGLASAGNLYYLGPSQRILYGFDSTGAPLGGGFPVSLPSGNHGGVAVDSNGVVFLGDTQNRVLRKYDAAGASLGAVPGPGGLGPYRIAFDSADNLFFSVPPIGGTVGLYKATAASGYSSVTQISTQQPDQLAVDTATDTLYAAFGFGGKRVSAFDAATGAHLYDFGYELGSSDFQDVAVREASDTVYVLEGSFTGGTSSTDRVHVYGPAQSYPDATATLNPAANLTDVSAELSAQIDDNGPLPTAWRLELSADGGLNWRTVASGQTEGGGSGVTVSGTAVGLDPNSAYQFRAVTNKGAAEATEVTTAPLSFTTVAPPPVISDVGAIEIQDASARLAGTIDPRNTEASYHFSYGTTPAADDATTPEIAIGGGLREITVHRLIEGLAPDTDYHFKLIATNDAGTTTGATQTFHTRTDPFPPANPPGGCANAALREEQGSTYLPDCRAYEMVSPPEKNLGSVIRTAGITGQVANISPDGDSVGFCTSSLFGDPAGQMGRDCAPYLSRRGAEGWQTTYPFPRYCPNDKGGEGGQISNAAFLAPDHSHIALYQPELEGCEAPLLDPAAPVPGVNLYRMGLGDGTPGFELLTPRNVAEGLPIGVTAYNALAVGGSENLSHIVYTTYKNQTDPPDSPPESAGVFLRLYEWTEPGEAGCGQPEGCLALVTKDTDGDPFATASSFSTPNPFLWAPNQATSRDGSRIYFQNPTEPLCGASCDLYLREGASTTIKVSAPECDEPSCGLEDSADFFKWATPDGAVALFTSCDRLTAASAPPGRCGSATKFLGSATTEGSKLYRFDRDAPQGSRLIDVSLDGEPADGVQPDVFGLIGASDDGNTVFFAARGQLVAGAPSVRPAATPQIGLSNPHAWIYRWQHNDGDPQVDYLGGFSSYNLGHSFGELDTRNVTQFERQVSPDGRYLMVQTRAALDPVADRDADFDVYRWSEEEGWRCASCQAPGAPSAGHSLTWSIRGTRTDGQSTPPVSGGAAPMTMSDDGRVFFKTPEALLPQDTNGEAGCPGGGLGGHQAAAVYDCDDVYEWNDGTLSLISSGTGTEDARLIGTTPSGNEVFFYTREQLVGHDKDSGVDIYAARSGGGFAEPAPALPGCEGEACRGPASAPADVPGAGSGEFRSGGNPPSQPNPCGRISKKAKHKLRAARKAARKGQAGRARALRKQARKLRSRAKRCNRRAAR